MLQKLAHHIAQCFDRAADCKRRAERTTDSAMKTEFVDLETSWTHLALSYEFVESLERFLLSARNHPNREAHHEPTGPDQSRSCPTCPGCGGTMRLFGIEAHPTVDRTDLRTYVCSHCDEVQTENIHLLNGSRNA
jgi:hypothetical protein